MCEKAQAMDDHNRHGVTVPYEAYMVISVAALRLQVKAQERSIGEVNMWIEALEAGEHP